MKVGDTHRIRASTCLSCGVINDAATGVDDSDKPYPGAITVCLTCGHIMAYADDLGLRELTVQEQIDVAGDKRILAIQRGRQRLGIKPK